ncbi:hypothetical protein ANO11243_078410 [Dothideomycetidae sp. 11243]|nr:hypothetical protein ANO11243_078410 [fungal sp. No.11243]
MAPSETRTRSRSPSRPKKSTGGFKWKDKTRTASDTDKSDRRDDKPYRERSPKYDSRPRERDGERHKHSDRKRERRANDDDDGGVHPDRRARLDNAEQKPKTDNTRAEDAPAPAVVDRKSTAAKFGARKAAAAAAAAKSVSTTTSNHKEEATGASAAMAAPKYVAPAAMGEMIVVHVNDRLGTKAAIPCLASDPVRAFKAMVAARIGRQPHEILIKRQGERPFKDQLTLEDYGVSNGVQLDLELDTGE